MTMFVLFFLTLLLCAQIILVPASNCTYNFEFQRENDEISCHTYAETKSQGLKHHIKLLEERLGQFQTKDDTGNANKCEKDYVISYPDCDAAKEDGQHISGPMEIIPVRLDGAISLLNSSDNDQKLGVAPVDVSEKRIKVFCDLESDEDHGWTVIMQRIKFDLNFNRTWQEYKNGFGEMAKGKDFWLGLEKMYQLTNQKNATYRLEIVLTSDSGAFREYLTMDKFLVLSEQDHYTLSIRSRHGNVHAYKLSQTKFQTLDHGRHVGSSRYGNCANYTVEVGGGGWWFRGEPRCYGSNKINCNFDQCGEVNLNAKVPYWKGINNIKGVQMKIRPIY